MSKDKKIVSIQYLRGVAALGVVFCHYGSNLTSYPNLSSYFNFGQTGVYVFFLVSGFIIVYPLIKFGYKPHQLFKFILKRYIRITPPYLGVILLTIVLFTILLPHILSFKGDKMPFETGQLIAHVFYVVPFTKYHFYNHVFWTLCVEFQFYFLIGALYFVFDSPIYKTTFLVLFSLTCLIPFNNSYYLVFTYAPIFALGMALITFYQNSNWINIILPSFLLCFIAYEFGIPVFILLVASSMIVFSLKLVIKPLEILGDISYSLYLTHPLTLIVFVGILKKLHVDINQNQLLLLFAEVITAILFAYPFYLFVEKPCIKLSKRISYRKKVVTKD